MKQDSYVVLDTDGRKDFTFTRKLMKLYILETVLLGLMALLAVSGIQDLIAKGEDPSLLTDRSDYTPLALCSAIVGVFLLSLVSTILLSVGARNNWKWPIVIISSLTIVIHIALAVGVVIYVLENLRTNGAQYAGVGAIFIICLAIAYGVRSLREALEFIPGVSLFNDGVLIDNFKEWELPLIVEMLAGIQIQETGRLNAPKSELWNVISEGVETGVNFRVARFDDEIVGFLMNRKSITRPGTLVIGDLCVYDSPIASQVASYLVRDFARLYSRSSTPVSDITLPSKFHVMHNAFRTNGWILTKNNKKSKTMSFKYVGLTDF